MFSLLDIRKALPPVWNKLKSAHPETILPETNFLALNNGSEASIFTPCAETV